MKKIIPLLLTITLAFVSCQTEPLGDDGLNAVEGKGSSSSDEDCYVNLTPTLPALVDACITAKPGAESYFLVDIASGDLAGLDIPAWCVDVDKTLGVECFEADVYSSYGSFPVGEFENPGNFDLVNWILNQDFISQGYTFGHIQWAIWELIDDENCQSCTYLTNPIGNWLTTDPNDVIKGQEIVDAAIAAGDGFEPVAGQNLAIILIPTDNTKQSIIIPYPLECEPEPSCETTFGKAQTEGEDGTSTCFIELEDLNANRWGWSVKLPGEGTYTFDIWGGAGQCDLSKGTLVGTAEVNYSGGTVDVVYTLNDGFAQNEVHTYAGYDPVATNEKNGKPTVAPGQYAIGTGLSGEIYVILHSVICGDYED